MFFCFFRTAPVRWCAPDAHSICVHGCVWVDIFLFFSVFCSTGCLQVWHRYIQRVNPCMTVCAVCACVDPSGNDLEMTGPVGIVQRCHFQVPVLTFSNSLSLSRSSLSLSVILASSSVYHLPSITCVFHCLPLPLPPSSLLPSSLAFHASPAAGRIGQFQSLIQVPIGIHNPSRFTAAISPFLISVPVFIINSLNRSNTHTHTQKRQRGSNSISK